MPTFLVMCILQGDVWVAGRSHREAHLSASSGQEQEWWLNTCLVILSFSRFQCMMFGESVAFRHLHSAVCLFLYSLVRIRFQLYRCNSYRGTSSRVKVSIVLPGQLLPKCCWGNFLLIIIPRRVLQHHSRQTGNSHCHCMRSEVKCLS